MSDWAKVAWAPTLNWESAAGITLKKAINAFGGETPVTLTVFGSAPLQLGVNADLLSADVDIFEIPQAEEKLRQAELLEGQAPIYIQICPANTFRAAPDWHARALKEGHGNVTLVLPHPLDILIAKLPRLDPKDVEAFLAVRAATGHPTEEELLEGLQNAVDIYRPGFDEEYPSDPVGNTRRIWQELFQKDIDVRKEIIVPATSQRRKSIGQSPEIQSQHNELGDIGKRKPRER
jgi:hypothetical protein